MMKPLRVDEGGGANLLISNDIQGQPLKPFISREGIITMK